MTRRQSQRTDGTEYWSDGVMDQSIEILHFAIRMTHEWSL
jgi:hypothetical protein